MTSRPKDELVQARADLILTDELRADAFTAHFETQMRRGRLKIGRLLRACYRHIACLGGLLAGFDDPRLG